MILVFKLLKVQNLGFLPVLEAEIYNFNHEQTRMASKDQENKIIKIYQIENQLISKVWISA